jgi:hypothetical protein
MGKSSTHWIMEVVVMQGSTRRRHGVGALVLLAVGASTLLAGCRIAFSPEGIQLDVPFEQQLPIAWDYCGPANVLMWRLYEGYPWTSQETIYATMGIGGQGTSPPVIASAVASWANISQASYEVQSCDGGPFDKRELIAARQITSIDGEAPVIVIVDGGFHAVMVTGGDWHHDSSTGLDVWDFTYIHDPQATSGHRYYSAGHWIDWFTFGYTCEQVFDGAVVGNTGYNLNTYGGNVVAYGYDGPRPGGDPIPK